MNLKTQKVLEIHEITDEMLNLDLSGFDILTFDDCLYSQYQHHSHFKQFNKPLIYFFSTNIYRKNENPRFLRCDLAHKQAIVYHDYSGYMSIDEIIKLSETEIIGLHGHNHLYLENRKKFDQLVLCKRETNLMLESFENFGLQTKYFQPPYNYLSYYHGFLKGYTSFINRIPIESLLIPKNPHKIWLNVI